MESSLKCIIGLVNAVFANYYRRRIRPYFKFVNATEIDETKFGAEIYKT